MTEQYMIIGAGVLASATFLQKNGIPLNFTLYPALMTTSVWALREHSDKILSFVPSLFKNYTTRINDILPLHPKNMVEAFMLGELKERLVSNLYNETEILIEAAEVVGRNSGVTADMLMNVGEEIQLMAENKGIVSTVISMFSLTNSLWAVAIAGLAVTTLPFIWYIAKPLQKLLVDIFTNAILPKMSKKARNFSYGMN